MKESLKYSYIDFGIVEGHRSPERQMKLYQDGKTKTLQSKHNLYPSHACDIIISNQHAYDFSHLAYIAGVVQSTALRLKQQGKISHLVRWGGNWDNDKIIIKDQSFQDLVHFELS